MKILREVKCSERLIISEGYYLVIRNNTKYYLFLDEQFSWREEDGTAIPDFKYDSWFEEVELDLKSEEILPTNCRVQEAYEELTNEADYCGIINLYNKALEAAELEIAELKVSKSAVRSNAKYIEKTVLKKFAEDNERLSKDAKERYEKACSNISWECIPNNIDKEQIKFNLKIAAGIN